MKHVVRIGLAASLIIALFLSTSPVYADDPPDKDSDTVVDVKVDGDVKASVNVTGPADLNVEARGLSKVDVNTDDQVSVDVEASEPSEVIVNQQKFTEPSQSDEQKEEESRNLLLIIAVAVPILGFLSFLFIRRKRSKGGSNETHG